MQAAAAAEAADALSMVKHETTKQLQAAERAQARAVEEAASIRQMLESASGEEASRLLDDLRDAEGRAQAAQGRADETQRAMSVRLLGLVARRWVMAAVVQRLASWRTSMAVERVDVRMGEEAIEALRGV